MKCPYCGGEATGKFCEYCGSEVPREKENVTIHITNNYYGEDAGAGNSAGRVSEPPKKKSRTWLWVLGWICMFPVPLTILMLRKKAMKPALKYGIIAAAWIMYLLIGLSGDTENVNTAEDMGGAEVKDQAGVMDTSDDVNLSDFDGNVYLENVVAQFNDVAAESLVFVEDFAPSDKDNSHYRTEFRLPAYQDALGKSYVMGDKTVDLVLTGTAEEDVSFRVYADAVSLEQVLDLVRNMSPLMDESLSAVDLNAAIKTIEEDKTANGYYYGELGMLLLGNDVKGYELMLKQD